MQSLTLKTKKKIKLKKLESYDPIAIFLEDTIVQTLKCSWNKGSLLKPGKMIFGRFAFDFDSQRQVSRMSFHSTFKALKTAKSNG